MTNIEIKSEANAHFYYIEKNEKRLPVYVKVPYRNTVYGKAVVVLKYPKYAKRIEPFTFTKKVRISDANLFSLYFELLKEASNAMQSDCLKEWGEYITEKVSRKRKIVDKKIKHEIKTY